MHNFPAMSPYVTHMCIYAGRHLSLGAIVNLLSIFSVSSASSFPYNDIPQWNRHLMKIVRISRRVSEWRWKNVAAMIRASVRRDECDFLFVCDLENFSVLWHCFSPSSIDFYRKQRLNNYFKVAGNAEENERESSPL